MVLLMKVSSRERPTTLLETVRLYLEKAANPQDMVWLFSFDEDDPALSDRSLNELIKTITGPFNHDTALYKWMAGDSKTFWIKNACIRFDDRIGKIGSINRDIDKVTDHWDILVSISDDQRPIVHGYDDKIRQAMPAHLDASLWFHDGWQGQINTQEILGRTYYENQGYVYHPSYKSFFCDNEATIVARRKGKLKMINETIIRHEHPQWTNTESDPLYEYNKQYWNEDRDNFNSRKALGFPK